MTEKSTQSQGKTWLFLIVFLTGASVMVIELLGTRLIAPFYGASLYVWSSLISVTMMALAVGYFAGGQWADSAQRTGLSLIIALAALFTLLIPWFTRPVLLATDPLGLRGGAFVSALVLFFPSLTMLGMVGPFAIKLATSELDGVGSSSFHLCNKYAGQCSRYAAVRFFSVSVALIAANFSWFGIAIVRARYCRRCL